MNMKFANHPNLGKANICVRISIMVRELSRVRTFVQALVIGSKTCPAIQARKCGLGPGHKEVKVPSRSDLIIKTPQYTSNMTSVENSVKCNKQGTIMHKATRKEVLQLKTFLSIPSDEKP